MLDDLLSNPAAYLPPRSALWLWIGGPLIALIIYFIVSRLDAGKKKRLKEAEIWRASIQPETSRAAADNKGGAPYRPDAKKKKDSARRKPSGPPRVASIPGSLHAALLAVGGGKAIAHYELVRGLAYLSLMEATPTAGSDYQTVTMKMEERGPQLAVHPLPLVDGVRAANTGVQFKKDPELMERFLVEGIDAKAIGKWLSPPVRRALCELPTAWLRVEGNLMTLSVFGTLEADQIDALVEVADTLFAEYGEGGASLFDGSVEGAAPTSARAAAPTSARAAAPTSARAAAPTSAPTSARGAAPTSSRGAAPISTRGAAPISTRTPAPTSSRNLTPGAARVTEALAAAKKKGAAGNYRTSTLAETPKAKKRTSDDED